MTKATGSKKSAMKPEAVAKPNGVADKAASAPAKAKPVAAKKAAASKTAKPNGAATKAKAAAKPAKLPAKLGKVVAKAKPVADLKVKKPKLVRDSFTMPEAEYQVLGDVKKACLKAGIDVKKSELLRVGVALIKGLDTAKLKAALAALAPLKAGRPRKEK